MNTDTNTNSRDPALFGTAPARWPAVVLVIVGLALSLGSFVTLRSAEFSRAQAEFAAEAGRWRALVQEQLNHTVESLRSVAALLDSSEVVTREEFRSFTRPILAEHSEITSFEWIPRVAAAQRAQFEEHARAEGLTDFRIKDLAGQSFVASPVRPEHYPIYYVEPIASNEAALGFDYAGRPRRSRAMFSARDSGQVVAATGFARLQGDAKPDELTVMLFLPRYAPGPLPQTIDERRDRLEGLAAVIFEMGAVLERVSERFTNPGIAFQVHSADGGDVFTPAPLPTPAHELETTSSLQVANLEFRLIAKATPAYAEPPNYTSAWVALVGGLLMTALVLGYLLSIKRQYAKRVELETERDRLFNLTPDLLCIAGLDGYFKQLSPAWERTLGYSRAELMSQPFFAFVHPDDVAATKERLQQLASGNDVLDFENRYRCANGEWRWLEWRSSVAPELKLTYAIARDVTQQRETNRELEHARRFAERVTDVMPSVLYLYDLRDQENVFINRQGALALGLPEDYLSSKGPRGVLDRVHPDDRARFLEHLEGLSNLEDGQIAELTYRVQHADGSWRWFHGRDAVFERDETGAVRRSIGTATDITAIKDAEVALRENNERLDFVLTTAKMGVWELNLETGAASWTEPLARLLRLEPEHTPRTLDEFLDLVHPDDRDTEKARFEQAIANRSIYQSEFRLATATNEVRWIAGLGKFVEAEPGKSPRLLGLMWDVTERKQAERDRARMQEQMRQSQKMEALGLLAGGIAHDFNNILTAINGNARLALEELPPDHPTRINMQEIHKGAMRATDLVRRILAFSRNEEPSLRQIDLGAVVEEAVRLVRATMPAMIDIRFQRHDPIPPVLADATQIYQVMMNLCANARDAMSERGGVLTIRLRERRMDAREIAATHEIRGQTCVCLTVEDTGAGMSREHLDRIFEPFFTTKAPGHGTGMGLAMVHGIVRRHGGVILASSQPGRGSKFDVYLPIAQQAAEPQEVPIRVPGMSARGEHILYVDDEESLVFLATRMLTRLGFRAEGQTDAREALRLFRRDPHRWDMVISDLGMPKMSGLDFAAEILRIRPDLPVLLTSGYVRLEDAERARLIGAEDIVLKPNTMDELAPIILERLAAARDNRVSRGRRS